MTEEAQLEQTESGLRPAGEGWVVVNVRDTAWIVHDGFGAGLPAREPRGGAVPEAVLRSSP